MKLLCLPVCAHTEWWRMSSSRPPEPKGGKRTKGEWKLGLKCLDLNRPGPLVPVPPRAPSPRPRAWSLTSSEPNASARKNWRPQLTPPQSPEPTWNPSVGEKESVSCGETSTQCIDLHPSPHQTLRCQPESCEGVQITTLMGP